MNDLKMKTESRSYYDDLFMALLPLILCATVIYSARVLLICAVAAITARVVDVGMALLNKKDIDAEDRSSIVAALTFSMMLPVSVPLYIVIITVGIVVLVGKHVFGGKDVYPFSLAALGMCMAAVNWPEKVFTAVAPLTEVNFWTGAATNIISGSTVVKLGGLPYISTFDLLLGNHAGNMGTGFILVILSVAVFLLVTKRITWHVPVTFIVTCMVFALLFPRVYGVSRIYSLKYEILCSSLIFFAIFVINEPTTTPKNPKAKIMFGFLCGLLTMLFRYYGGFEIGGCFALLLVNATVGFWDRIFEEKDFTVKKMLSFAGEIPMKKISVKKHHKGEDIILDADAGKVKPMSANKIAEQPAKKAEEPVKEAQPKQTEQKKAENPVKKQPVKNSSRKKTNKKKTTQDKKKKETAGADALKMIAHAEDNIDQVEFSTQTIDMAQALKEFEEKYGKEGK